MDRLQVGSGTKAHNARVYKLNEHGQPHVKQRESSKAMERR